MTEPDQTAERERNEPREAELTPARTVPRWLFPVMMAAPVVLMVLALVLAFWLRAPAR